MLNQPSNPKLIIGSRRTGITGETIVPGAPHEPAKSCSPTPSTRPNDPKLIYIQPRMQKKASNESFPTTPSAPRSSKNSSSTTIPKTDTAAAATPQAAKPAGIAARPHDARAHARTVRSTAPPSTAIDVAKPRAPPTHDTTAKKPAADISAAVQVPLNCVPRLPPYALSTEQCGGRSAERLGCFASPNNAAEPHGPPTHATTTERLAADPSAAQRAKQAEAAMKSRNARPSTITERNTTGTTTTTGAVKSRAPWTANLEAAANTHAADNAVPIDVVHGSDHYDSLIDVRLLKTNSPPQMADKTTEDKPREELAERTQIHTTSRRSSRRR